MTAPSRGSYNRRGAIDLKRDDHGAWAILCDRLARGLSFEDIANELGVSVAHLLEWANCSYRPQERKSRHLSLPKGSPVYQQAVAAERVRSGVRLARRLASR